MQEKTTFRWIFLNQSRIIRVIPEKWAIFDDFEHRNYLDNEIDSNTMQMSVIYDKVFY